MESDKRKLLTWSLNAGTTAYETDLEQYGNKIYALALHEIQVEKDGICYMRRDLPSIPSTDNYGAYIPPATSFDKNRSFWVAIESGMRRWEHIRGYLSFILFGAGRVIPMLDNVGGAQDTLIAQIKATLDHFGTSSYFTSDPNNMQYIKGVEIDFEASMSGQTYADRVGDATKFMNILKRIKNEVCIPRGLALQVNAYAMWGKDTPFYYRFHDYELFANSADAQGNSVIDELQIMTYDFAWNGSAPGASTPLWWFENVTAWAKTCFHSGALLTIDNVFFGAAAYGHRWGIYDYDRMYGSTITYRNFVDWQNGLYKHNHSNGDGTYTWHDQEFLPFAAIEDQESKNQVLQQHIYDYFKARHGNIRMINGAASARISNYNGGEYATTYSRVQKASFTNIVARSFSPSSTNAATTNNKVTPYSMANTPLTTNEDGIDKTTLGIIGYRLSGSSYIPALVDGAAVCSQDEQGKVTYTLNVPSGGSYRLIALTSFAWYSQRKVAGTLNGSSLVMEATEDFYPLMFKASHWYDCGLKTFNTGANTIVIDGDASNEGAIIYGFIVCSDFKHNFGGGEIDYKSTIAPFKKKDGSTAALPPNLSITAKALRQAARPLIMWEDRFTPFFDDPTASADLTTSAYYTKNQTRTAKGNGSELSSDGTYCYDPANAQITYGHSWGIWQVKKDDYKGNPDNVYTQISDPASRGRLIVNHEFNSNVQVEAEFRIESKGQAGIQFGGSSGTDGYVLVVNYSTRKLVLSYNDSLVKEEALPANYVIGDRIKLKAIIHNGQGYFYLGYGNIKSFGGVAIAINRNSGGYCGLYSNLSDARFYLLSISTTDKWDLMEKFTIEATVNGTQHSQTFGEINRPGYTIDPNFGYLNYSGINEINTRSETPPTGGGGEEEQYSEDVSLDYEFWITDIPSFTGATDIKVKFDDPGIWFAHLYVVDKEGGSITWVGDSYSFLDTMNKAVNEIGAKGIGMWVMGQEDPRVFETIPDVVSYHK